VALGFLPAHWSLEEDEIQALEVAVRNPQRGTPAVGEVRVREALTEHH
jgi:hypothetical protein